MLLGVDVEGARDAAADVGPVPVGLREGDELALVEDRPDDAHVVEVRAAEVGIVDGEDVARVDVVLEGLDHGLAVKCSVPTWTAMSWLPCMTVSPFASQSADEKSRA